MCKRALVAHGCSACYTKPLRPRLWLFCMNSHAQATRRGVRAERGGSRRQLPACTRAGATQTGGCGRGCAGEGGVWATRQSGGAIPPCRQSRWGGISWVSQQQAMHPVSQGQQGSRCAGRLLSFGGAVLARSCGGAGGYCVGWQAGCARQLESHGTSAGHVCAAAALPCATAAAQLGMADWTGSGVSVVARVAQVLVDAHCGGRARQRVRRALAGSCDWASNRGRDGDLAVGPRRRAAGSRRADSAVLLLPLARGYARCAALTARSHGGCMGSVPALRGAGGVCGLEVVVCIAVRLSQGAAARRCEGGGEERVQRQAWVSKRLVGRG